MEFLFLAPIIVPGLALIMVMAGVFTNYNVDFERQAHSLGTGPLRTFVQVTLRRYRGSLYRVPGRPTRLAATAAEPQAGIQTAWIISPPHPRALAASSGA